jgi:hypothetical protein
MLFLTIGVSGAPLTRKVLICDSSKRTEFVYYDHTESVGRGYEWSSSNIPILLLLDFSSVNARLFSSRMGVERRHSRTWRWISIRHLSPSVTITAISQEWLSFQPCHVQREISFVSIERLNIEIARIVDEWHTLDIERERDDGGSR